MMLAASNRFDLEELNADRDISRFKGGIAFAFRVLTGGVNGETMTVVATQAIKSREPS